MTLRKLLAACMLATATAIAGPGQELAAALTKLTAPAMDPAPIWHRLSGTAKPEAKQLDALVELLSARLQLSTTAIGHAQALGHQLASLNNDELDATIAKLRASLASVAAPEQIESLSATRLTAIDQLAQRRRDGLAAATAWVRHASDLLRQIQRTDQLQLARVAFIARSSELEAVWGRALDSLGKGTATADWQELAKTEVAFGNMLVMVNDLLTKSSFDNGPVRLAPTRGAGAVYYYGDGDPLSDTVALPGAGTVWAEEIHLRIESDLADAARYRLEAIDAHGAVSQLLPNAAHADWGMLPPKTNITIPLTEAPYALYAAPPAGLAGIRLIVAAVDGRQFQRETWLAIHAK